MTAQKKWLITVNGVTYSTQYEREHYAINSVLKAYRKEYGQKEHYQIDVLLSTPFSGKGR